MNIGSGVEMSVAQVHKLVSAATRQAIPPVPAAARFGDIERKCLGIDRAASSLGWMPRIGLATGVAALASANVEASA